MSCLVDDFDGERPYPEDLSTERLQEIHAKTLRALCDPRCLTPRYFWIQQLELIEDEIQAREILRDKAKEMCAK